MCKGHHLLITIFSACFISLSGTALCNAETMLHGCPDDELVQITYTKITVCPICGLPLKELKEGYIADERISMVWVDTLSKEEKKLADKNDSNLKIIIYTAPNKKKSFESCKGCKRELVTLRYICNNEKYACKDKINETCEEIGFRSVQQDQSEENREKTPEQLIEERLDAHKARMHQALEGSWPIFQEQQKNAGFTEEEIADMFEEVRKQIYQQFKYDPINDTFDEAKLKEELADDH
ncbi:MAG: hypothetical protein WC695_04460 [Candidatus Omnitrophota bacterium]